MIQIRVKILEAWSEGYQHTGPKMTCGWNEQFELLCSPRSLSQSSNASRYPSSQTPKAVLFWDLVHNFWLCPRLPKESFQRGESLVDKEVGQVFYFCQKCLDSSEVSFLKMAWNQKSCSWFCYFAYERYYQPMALMLSGNQLVDLGKKCQICL